MVKIGLLRRGDDVALAIWWALGARRWRLVALGIRRESMTLGELRSALGSM